MKTSIGAPRAALSAHALALNSARWMVLRLLLLTVLAIAGCADACSGPDDPEASATPPPGGEQDCPLCGDDDDDVSVGDEYTAITFSVEFTVIPNAADDDDSGK